MSKQQLKRILRFAFMTLCLPGVIVLSAEDPTFELSHEQFVVSSFGAEVPESERVLIRGELRNQVESILQHPIRFLRTRYWLNEEQSVWIMDEIGRERPITIGVVVSRSQEVSRIKEVKVLAFRESRGWEISQDFFTEQFSGVGRDASGQGLDTVIDGITGATLSVRAVRKIAEIALLLDNHVRNEQD